MLRPSLVYQRANRLFAFSRRLGQSSLTLPLINPKAFNTYDLTLEPELTGICQALRSMRRERICENPVVDAYCTTNGESILGYKLCSDVIFVRAFYESLFKEIRRNRCVVLTGNPGVSKSV